MFGFIRRITRFAASHIRIFIPAFIFALLCSIVLLIVLYTRFLRPAPLPVSVIVSDVYANQAVVNVVAHGAPRMCTILVSPWPMDLRISCAAPNPHGTYRLSVAKLVPATTYWVFVGHDVYWWPVSSVRMLARTVIQRSDMIVRGAVVSTAGAARPRALVVGKLGKRDVYFSVYADENGTFAVIVPSLYIPLDQLKPSDDELTVMIWTDREFGDTSYHLSLNDDTVRRVTLRPYE